MRASHTIDLPLSWQAIAGVARGLDVVLSEPAKDRIRRSRDAAEKLMSDNTRCYGLNTGVGGLCNEVIAPSDRSRLSENIAFSHHVGVGQPLSREQTRGLLAAKINLYALGYSGIRLEVVERLCAFLDNDCLPVIPAKGSLGYLSHSAPVALSVFGEGDVFLRGERMTASQALSELGLAPLQLEAKEGLSLVSGTGCASGFAALALSHAHMLLDWADAAAAMSFENLRCDPEGLSARTLALRPSPDMATVGEALRFYLRGSQLAQGPGLNPTQPPLSLRAISQVHGGVRRAVRMSGETLDLELASCTDNPAIWEDNGEVHMASQAHTVAAELAMSLDSLALALAHIGVISERRIDRLVNPMVSNLPAFLAAAGGLHNGFQIAHYTAVSLVGENRRLAQPSSLDGGVTAGLQEDYLAHATPSALKALDLLENIETILAIELLCAAQAYDVQPCGAQGKRGHGTEGIYQYIREAIGAYDDRRPLAKDIEMMRRLMWMMPYPASMASNVSLSPTQKPEV
ncbi:histidine ammonia-lyase [Roseibium sp. CAU 1637]|uniref:Histidine ammonia-lyase n=1 Tax=Roseibium limicola TaxID=2816037 RepID=A0A939EM79_9HYPH|nr:histidine ammonia-lyase [Roseibium limicola]MBO0344402.1 histidine ammonia-lyase [Roseibium limicola]